MKPLDMADKYDPLSYQDDEPTIKMQVPYFYPKVIVSDDGTGVEVIEHMGSPEDVGDVSRDTIPCEPPYPHPYEEKRYPGVGLLITLGFGLIFWGTLGYFIFR